MQDPIAKKKAVLAFLAEQPYTTEDVQYGFVDDKPLMATIYRPKVTPNKAMPAVIYIHGGGFTGGARDHFESTAAYLTNQGYVGVCISYRLAPKDKFPKPIQDCKCAVRWTRANAKKWNIDPEKIAVCGSSAGGSLAGMVAYAQGIKEFEGLGGNPEISDKVQAAVLFCGLYDLTPIKNDENRPHKNWADYLGGTYEEVPLVCKKASPVNYVSKQSPPTLLLHGNSDTTVHIEQSYQLQKKLNEFGIYNEMEIAENGTHKAYDFLMPHCIIAMKQMEAFLLKIFN
jgi:acetyl esterase/lipase